eukprot:NODE_3372_length_2046_cov_9.969776.p1 GENE.NODE_3372_length_2046_cov_9.969776~~NODE_3372_length_2046_cov_9.969776.p1  ORF type:complete len:595 (+),score=151.35 NODE_3372_length_2046_cov_9.969776:246-1787(+)
MRSARKAVLATSAEELKCNWDVKNPMMVREPSHAPKFYVAEPPITHIRQRRERWQREARAGDGLTEMPQEVKCERRPIGLDYIKSPPCPTRTSLLEKRQASDLRRLGKTRVAREADYLTRPHRKELQRERDNFSHATGPNAMTAGKLEASRQLDRLDVLSSTFNEQPKWLPAYADQDEPWWTLQRGYVPSAARRSTSLPSATTPPQRKAVAMAPRQPQELQVAEMFYRPKKAEDLTAPTTGRLFDTITPATENFMDYLPLGHFSSFRVIQQASMAKSAAERKTVLEASGRIGRRREWERAIAGESTGRFQLADVTPVHRRRKAASVENGVQLSSGTDGTNPRLPSQMGVRAELNHTNLSRNRSVHSLLETKPSMEDPSMAERLDHMAGTIRRPQPMDDLISTPGELVHHNSRPQLYTVDEAGALGKTASPTAPPAPFAVRTGGFQWGDLLPHENSVVTTRGRGGGGAALTSHDTPMEEMSPTISMMGAQQQQQQQRQQQRSHQRQERQPWIPM